MNKANPVKRRNLIKSLAAGIGATSMMSAASVTASEDLKQNPLNNGNSGQRMQTDGYKAVQIRDAMWAYKDRGDGPPALFLHSFLLSSNLWLDQINGLKDMRRCIAPDMRGWGQSEPVTDEAPDLYKYAEDVIEFLDKINIREPVDIVGLSVGAFISGLVYEMAPEKVNSLTLISGSFKFKPNPVYQRYQREMARLVVVEGKDALFRRFDEYIDGKNPSLHNRARYKQMLLDTRMEMIVAYLTSSGNTKERPDLPAKIKVPVLLPMGTDDSIFSTEQIEKLSADYPNARTGAVKGAGRLIPMENPDQLNAMLKEFWTEDAAR